jgi:hypothetical protein
MFTRRVHHNTLGLYQRKGRVCTSRCVWTEAEATCVVSFDVQFGIVHGEPLSVPRNPVPGDHRRLVHGGRDCCGISYRNLCIKSDVRDLMRRNHQALGAPGLPRE